MNVCGSSLAATLANPLRPQHYKLAALPPLTGAQILFVTTKPICAQSLLLARHLCVVGVSLLLMVSLSEVVIPTRQYLDLLWG